MQAVFIFKNSAKGTFWSESAKAQRNPFCRKQVVLRLRFFPLPCFLCAVVPPVYSPESGQKRFCYSIARTSAALVSGLTLGITLMILPASSMRKVVRTTPMLTLPYSFFSCQTPYARIACKSGSESRTKGRPNFSANLPCEAALSLLIPITTAFFSRNALKSEANAHAWRVHPGVLSFG